MRSWSRRSNNNGRCQGQRGMRVDSGPFRREVCSLPHFSEACMASSTDIESVLKEQRVFACSDEFAAAAHVKSADEYERLYRQSTEDPEAFWAGIAREL